MLAAGIAGARRPPDSESSPERQVVTSPTASIGETRRAWPTVGIPIVGVATAAAFLAAFIEPLRLLAAEWWTDPDSGHGLLIVPLAAWLVWRAGRRSDAAPAIWLGALVVAGAVVLRLVSGVAAELYTLRLAALITLAGLVVFHFGVRQLLSWWLPFALLFLAVPLPAVLLGAVAMPLQLVASQLGAALLEARGVPALVTGNIIRLPGQELFVTEACSGLRSLTALLALALLLGGLSLRTVLGRVVLLAIAVPIAVAVNALRVFLTGYSVYYISPAAGEGVLHATEGWGMFLGAFALIAGCAFAIERVERLPAGRGA